MNALPRHPHLPELLWHAWAVVPVLLLGSGCGAPDSSVAATDNEPGAQEAQVAPDVNTCPSFAFYFVLPKEIPREQVARLIVQGTDEDSDDAELVYAWEASSGTFADSSRPITTYRCDQVGPQLLTVTATDSSNCSKLLALDVDCLQQ